MRKTIGWVAIAVAVLFVVFNFESASVWFFGIRVQMPLGLVVIFSALLGVLGSYAFASLKPRR